MAYWRALLLIVLHWACMFDLYYKWCGRVVETYQTAESPHTISLEVEPMRAVLTRPHHKLNGILKPTKEYTTFHYIYLFHEVIIIVKPFSSSLPLLFMSSNIIRHLWQAIVLLPHVLPLSPHDLLDRRFNGLIWDSWGGIRIRWWCARNCWFSTVAIDKVEGWWARTGALARLIGNCTVSFEELSTALL